MLARDDVIRMAREVGASSPLSNFNHAEGDLLERFAAAAYAAGQDAEREACAKVCEDISDNVSSPLWSAGAYDCAEAIRARAEKGGE